MRSPSGDDFVSDAISGAIADARARGLVAGVLVCNQRQLDAEPRSARRRTLHAHTTAMLLREAPYEREADATSSYGRIGVALETVEGLPDPVTLGGRDSRSFVRDRNPRALPLARSLERYRDGLSRRTVLHGVVEQVDQYLPHRSAIDFGDDARVQGLDHDDLSRLGQRSEGLEHLGHERGELGGLRQQRALAAFGAVEAKHLVHQVTEPSRFLVDDVERARVLLGRSNPAHTQQ